MEFSQLLVQKLDNLIVGCWIGDCARTQIESADDLSCYRIISDVLRAIKLPNLTGYCR